jgi:DNA-binding transcriptional LysR family regulator
MRFGRGTFSTRWSRQCGAIQTWRPERFQRLLDAPCLVPRRVIADLIKMNPCVLNVHHLGKPNDAAHDCLLHRAHRRYVKPFQAGTPRFLCDDLLLLRELARRGAGIAMLPESFAAPYVQDGSLEEVPVSLPDSISGGLFLVYPSSGEVPRKVTAFRDFLLEWLKKIPFA